MITNETTTLAVSELIQVAEVKKQLFCRFDRTFLLFKHSFRGISISWHNFVTPIELSLIFLQAPALLDI